MAARKDRDIVRELAVRTARTAALVRNDLLQTRRARERHGCPLEFILKDISTVRYDPARLFEWGRIAMEVAGG